MAQILRKPVFFQAVAIEQFPAKTRFIHDFPSLLLPKVRPWASTCEPLKLEVGYYTINLLIINIKIYKIFGGEKNENFGIGMGVSSQNRRRYRPPRIGTVSRIGKTGHEIHLITVEFGHAPMYEVVEGIRVHRVLVGHARDFFHWVANLNQSMGHQGGKLMLEEGPFDIIHAHDWLVGDAAIALKHTFKVPLIATIHATEYGRFNGIHNDGQRYINTKENDLAYNAWRVIVCSDYMRREAERVLSTPWNKIEVIYNGIRPEKKPRWHEFDAMNFRRQFATDDEKIVYYVGRISYEKGISVFLNAAPKVIWEMGGQAKIVIVGGGNTDHLKHLAWHLGIWNKCYFTGFMFEENLDKFQTVADCAVFPSLYEPFGDCSN